MNCKIYIVGILLFYLLLVPCYGLSQNIKNKNNNAKLLDISGTWTWFSKDRSKQFTLKIRDCKSKIFKAQYCAVYNYGVKMDCDFDSINNISGITKGEVIKVKFYSFFNAKDGKAEIKIINKSKLFWKIKKIPNGEYYAPLQCFLIKK